jgi:hypothetical protein
MNSAVYFQDLKKSASCNVLIMSIRIFAFLYCARFTDLSLEQWILAQCFVLVLFANLCKSYVHLDDVLQGTGVELGDRFSYSVCILGDTIVVGADYEGSSASEW